MWIARDNNNRIVLHNNCPKRDKNSWFSGDFIGYLNNDLFPELKWENDPIEVKLIKIKE